jgi:hypothetical protein
MEGLFKIWLFIVGTISIIVLASQLASGIVAISSGIRVNKDKRSFFMGITLILTGLEAILSIYSSFPVTTVIVRNLSMDNVALYSTFSGLVSTAVALLGVASTVLFSLYFIKNYQTGKAHLIVALAARVISVVISIFSKMSLASYITKKAPLWSYIAVFSAGLIFSIISFIAITTLAGKTGKYEPQRRSLFVFPMLLMIYSTLSAVLNTLFTVSRGILNGKEELIMLMLPLMGAAIIIAGSLYIVKTRNDSDII